VLLDESLELAARYPDRVQDSEVLEHASPPQLAHRLDSDAQRLRHLSRRERPFR
jgi:hypothetical protein